MTQQMHTPGPWRRNQYGHLVCYPEGLEVGILSSQLPEAEREANASLIEAAPDMLAALRGYIAQIDAVGLPDDAETTAIRAAIAKAEGSRP